MVSWLAGTLTEQLVCLEVPRVPPWRPAHQSSLSVKRVTFHTGKQVLAPLGQSRAANMD